MKREWKIEWVPSAHMAGWPGIDMGPSPHCWGLWLFEDGVPVCLLGVDGGEPEDQTLVRDWSWVRDACAEAYAMGLADAAAKAKEDET